MRAKITLTHEPYASDDNGTRGWYCVTIACPTFDGVDEHHRTFCYGPEEVYQLAQDALEAAIEYHEGANAMGRMLAQGGTDTTLGLLKLRMDAKKIDEAS